MKKSPLLPVYRRSNITMERGEGAYLFDDADERYLDFGSGIAVNVLGHSHPKLVEALKSQAEKLWHCSNLFSNAPLNRYAQKLVDAARFADNVFLCSSGTEAVETALKMVRRHHYVADRPDKVRIITPDGAFHGRSTGALSACAHAPSREGFEPLLRGFDHVPYNDIKALEAAITPHTAAILLEPIQGEGGVRAHSNAYMKAARKLADKHEMLLVLDEIQCGFGRTGSLFVHEEFDIQPDIVTCAKGIGGGFPLAAVLATDHAARGLTRGTHGSTYGSNPLASAVGEVVLDELLQSNHLINAAEMGTLLKEQLKTLVTDYPSLYTDVRGRGLMLGVVVADGIDKHIIAERLREEKLIVVPAVSNVIRILPPLIIDETHINEAMAILHNVSQTMTA